MSNLYTPSAPSTRRIGRMGAIGRVVLGLVFLGIAASWEETEVLHWLAGLIGVPLLTLLVMGALRWGRPDARWTGPEGYLANTGIAVAIFLISPPTGFVFYGAAMLLAAGRGYAGCELLAYSNAILRRDDEIGCPVFAPIDAVEADRSAQR